MHILDEGPKTLLGLVIRARAEKWLRRHLWTLAYDSLSPLEQGVRVVIDSTMRIDCDRPRQVFALGQPSSEASVSSLGDASTSIRWGAAGAAAPTPSGLAGTRELDKYI